MTINNSDLTYNIVSKYCNVEPIVTIIQFGSKLPGIGNYLRI